MLFILLRTVNTIRNWDEFYPFGAMTVKKANESTGGRRVDVMARSGSIFYFADGKEGTEIWTGEIELKRHNQVLREWVCAENCSIARSKGP
jgi:hypothetical protein